MHIMLDLETLGTRPGCKILQIAAVTMPRLEGEFSAVRDSFNEYVAQTEQEGLHVSEATLAWWQKQAPATYLRVCNGTTPLLHALFRFEEFLTANSAKQIWGNGGDFDFPILREASRILGGPTFEKWNFSSRCYRTVKSMYPGIQRIKPKQAHDAIYDAEAQALHLEMIAITQRIVFA